MRPYIDRCQDLPNGIDGYLPDSASDIAITAQGVEVDAALAISLVRRAEVVHHGRCHRSADVRHVLRRWSSRGARACSTAPSLASAMR
jgi:hypothetical protein